MIYCENDYDLTFLEKILEFLAKDGEIELLFVQSEEMREINLETRKIDKATDVLSFPHEKMHKNDRFLGSIVINLDKVSEAAKEFLHSEDEEIALLFIHACLHLLGYDHEIDNGQMRERECEIIQKFNLPKSLIVRTLG